MGRHSLLLNVLVVPFLLAEWEASAFQLSSACSKPPSQSEENPCVCPTDVRVEGPVTNSSWIWNYDYGTWQPRINDKNDAPIKIAGDGVAGGTFKWEFMEGSTGNKYVVQELTYWGVPEEGAVDDAKTSLMRDLPGGPNGTKIMDRFGAHVANVVYSCQMVWSGVSGRWWTVLSATSANRDGQSTPIVPSCSAGAATGDCPVSPTCYLRKADCAWDPTAEDWNCGDESGVGPCAWDPSGIMEDSELNDIQMNNNLYDSCNYPMLASTMAFPAAAMVEDPTSNQTVVIGNPATTRNGAELKPADGGVGGGLFDTLLLCEDVLDVSGKTPVCSNGQPAPGPSPSPSPPPPPAPYSNWPQCPSIVKSYWTRTMCQGFLNCLNVRLIENYAVRVLSMRFLSVIFTGGGIFAAGWLFFFFNVRDPPEGEEPSDVDKKLRPPSAYITAARKKGSRNAMRCSICTTTIVETGEIEVLSCSHCGAPRKQFLTFSKYVNDWVKVDLSEPRAEEHRRS